LIVSAFALFSLFRLVDWNRTEQDRDLPLDLVRFNPPGAGDAGRRSGTAKVKVILGRLLAPDAPAVTSGGGWLVTSP